MPETAGQSRETHEARSNVRDLIVDHLGIDFKNPPKEIPLTFVNRIRHFKLVQRFKDDSVGEYFPEKNTVLYKKTSEPQAELRRRLHESMHALFHEVNPDYFQTIKDLWDFAANPSIRVELARAFARGEIGDKQYLRTMYFIGRANDVGKVYRAIYEGVAQWGALEVQMNDRGVTTEKHLGVINGMYPLLDKEAQESYLSGHKFVTAVIDYLARTGMTKGEALLRLMTHPPLFPEDLAIGGAKYAEENLI